MSLDIYLRLRAARAGRAQPRASRRHAHLAPRPMVVIGYHLAGDPGAPVALRYGTTPEWSRTVVVPEPRDRTLRFAQLAGMARDLNRYLDGFTARDPDGADVLCVDAPQLVCPNQTTAAWFTDTLGRSLRYLRTGGDPPVDPDLPLAGAHLTYFAGRRALPGSCAVLAATDLLTTHWVTGQLPAEDAHLGTLLAWVTPPAGRPAAEAAVEAAVEAELGPTAGPESDPGWDQEVLRPLIGDYGRARDGGSERAALLDLTEACTEALAPAWRHTWRALELVAGLPEAGHVPDRWLDDRRAWTRHRDRADAGAAYFRKRLDELRSFRFLHELETRTVTLARQMALDDPLLMAGQVAVGDALTGWVVARDCAHRVTSAKGRGLLRPVLWVRPVVPFDRPAGTMLWWAADTRVRAQAVAVSGNGTVELAVVAGACASQERAERALPRQDDLMTLIGAGDDRFPDVLPEHLPWTHTAAEPEREREPEREPAAGGGAG